MPPTGDRSAAVDPERWYEQSSVLSWLFDRSKEQEIPQHYLVNGFANSWFVQQTGTYDIVIEFAPQRLYEAGWMVSLATLMTSAVAFILWSRRSS